MPTCYRHPGRETYIRCQRCERPICPDCMRDAAVGFQCPQCVAEGRKGTRSGRTAYGGTRSGNPALTSIVLIAVNAVVWLAIMATGAQASRLVDLLGLRPRGLCAIGRGGYDVSQQACASNSGTWLPGAADGAWWQVITNVFTHVEVWHIGFNMLALWFLGPMLEAVVGRTRFLAIYLLSGLAGSAAVLWLAPEFQSTVGASGAIFGLMGALLVVALKSGGNVSQIATWLLINAVFTFAGPANISWQGHLGGFLGGCVVAAVLAYAPRGPRRTAYQLVGLGAVLAGLVLAVAVRIASLG